jgi:hypothetical protein
MIVMFILWKVLSLHWPRIHATNFSRTPLLTPMTPRVTHTHGFWSGDVVDLRTVDLTRDEYIEDEEDKDEQKESNTRGGISILYDWLV